MFYRLLIRRLLTAIVSEDLCIKLAVFLYGLLDKAVERIPSEVDNSLWAKLKEELPATEAGKQLYVYALELLNAVLPLMGAASDVEGEPAVVSVADLDAAAKSVGAELAK